MSTFDGMQPTRAQVVPAGPPLMSRKLSVLLRTSRNADNPAVPAPRMATSTDRSGCISFRVSIDRNAIAQLRRCALDGVSEEAFTGLPGRLPHAGGRALPPHMTRLLDHEPPVACIIPPQSSRPLRHPVRRDRGSPPQA